MELYLVRHGPALERDPRRWPGDRGRPLSPSGTRATRRSARGLAEATGPIDALAASPFARARATALIVAAAYERSPRVEIWEELASGAPARPILERLARSGRPGPRVVLVGHEPTLGGLLGLALTGESVPLARLSKGGAAALEFPRKIVPGGARLLWLLTRRQLAGLGS